VAVVKALVNSVVVTVALLGVVLGSGRSEAATIVQQLDFSQTGGSSGYFPCTGTTDETRNCFHRYESGFYTHTTFDGFDNSLGTLTAITFDTTLTVEFETQYLALDDYPPWTPQTTTANIYVGYQGSSLFPPYLFNLERSLEQAECADCTLFWSTSATQQFTGYNPILGSEFSENEIWGGFEIYINGGGLLSRPAFGTGARVSGFMRQTYHYDPVPEPGTFVLLASGVTSLAMRRRYVRTRR